MIYLSDVWDEEDASIVVYNQDLLFSVWLWRLHETEWRGWGQWCNVVKMKTYCVAHKC